MEWLQHPKDIVLNNYLGIVHLSNTLFIYFKA